MPEQKPLSRARERGRLRSLQPGVRAIPGAGEVQTWDRYAAMGSNPVKYVDPTGHMQACPDGDEGGGCGSSNDNVELSYSFDTKAIAEEYIPFTPEQLRNWAMKFDHFALGVDALAESIVLGHVGVGTVAGTAFEGNPVSGIPSGAGAGWILGETNPVVQSLVTLGNFSAILASTSGILADVKTGDSRIQFQVSLSTNNLSLNGSASVSSNSIASGYLTTLGWATRIVEGSLLVQGAAVAFDHGVVPTYIITLPFSVQISNR